MNSRRKGKRGELEFAEFLRTHGFDARRGQQFSGGADSPDVVSQVLSWMHIEVKRVQHLNLAEACAQARRQAVPAPNAGPSRTREGAAEPKVWIVAHRRNREPWFITMDSDALYQLLHRVPPYFDLWPFVGPRPITMDAELFFQFLRAACAKRDCNNGNGTDGTHRTDRQSQISGCQISEAVRSGGPGGQPPCPSAKDFGASAPENRATEQTK